MPHRAIAAAALADWRIAERDMAGHPEGSPAWQEAAARSADAKARYQQAIDGARAAHTPEPPSFEDASAAPG